MAANTSQQPVIRTRLTPQGAQYFALGQRLAQQHLERHAQAVRNHEWSVVLNGFTYYLEPDEDGFYWAANIAPRCPCCTGDLTWHAEETTKAPARMISPSEAEVCCWFCDETYPMTEAR